MRTYFFSDLHLLSGETPSANIFKKFLHSLENQVRTGDALFLLGDIFDLWIADHTIFVDKYWSVIEQIQKLQKLGMRIVFFEGNHDVHIKAYWEKNLGAEVFVAPEYFQLGPWTVRCEHGDVINLEDRAYLRYRKIIRHPWVKPLGNLLPGKFWMAVAGKASIESRKHSSKFRNEQMENLRQILRDFAVEQEQIKTFDLLVTGHLHVRDDFSWQVGGKTKTSINLGSWMDEPAYLFLDETGWKFQTIS